MGIFSHADHGRVMADRNRVEQELDVPGGTIDVPIGHWIVSTSTGRIVVSDSDFRASYAPIDDYARDLLAHFQETPIPAPAPSSPDADEEDDGE